MKKIDSIKESDRTYSFNIYTLSEQIGFMNTGEQNKEKAIRSKMIPK